MKQQIGLDELASLEVDTETGQLYWNGKPLKTVERVSFGWLGTIVGLAVSFASIISPALYYVAEYDSINKNVCASLGVFC